MNSIRLIGLDTNVPGKCHGYLCQERLDWLEVRLTEAPDTTTIIFQHHPPFLTGINVLDSMHLENADAFGAIIARFNNVERILAGHVHCAVQQRFSNTLALTCPSTAHQVYPDFHNEERVKIVMEHPACLLHLWRENTSLVTHTSYI